MNTELQAMLAEAEENADIENSLRKEV